MCAAALVAAAPVSGARAGALTVMPVKVEIAPGEQFCSLTIGNDGPEAVSVQLRGYYWRQGPDGEDLLDLAPQFVINPSIVAIAPGQRRLVRCSVPNGADLPEETYRILVNELPRAAAGAGVLQTLLQLSIPVFRTEAGARPRIGWSRDESGCITLSNAGTAHARLASVQLRTAQSGAQPAVRGFYLLAGTSRPLDQCNPAADAVIGVDATFSDGSVSAVEQQSAASQ